MSNTTNKSNDVLRLKMNMLKSTVWILIIFAVYLVLLHFGLMYFTNEPLPQLEPRHYFLVIIFSIIMGIIFGLLKTMDQDSEERQKKDKEAFREKILNARF